MSAATGKDVSIKELRDRWLRLFGHPAPPRAGRELLELAIGWHRQSKLHGGFDRALREQIAGLVDDVRHGREPGQTPRPSKLRPGVTLVREWNGRSFKVLVLEKGFAFDDKVWGSLSEIAREITGARWNGPMFFGLRQGNKAKDASETMEVA